MNMSDGKESSYFACYSLLSPYTVSVMPRGKRVVYTMTCPESGIRLGTIRLHKQDRTGKSYKDHAENLSKYSPAVRKHVKPKLKEERHSS